MPSLLVDTHILIWWQLDSRRLAREHAALLEEQERLGRPLGISAISLWEIAMMVARGRLEVSKPLDLWLEEMEASPLLVILPLTARVATESVRLGDDFQRDPADRIIVATARCHGLRLLTADERIRRWGKVPLA